MIESKVLIIGAGPAGITSALYLKRANVPFVWLEKGAPGGKLITVAEVSNYPGLPHQSGLELAFKLLESTNVLGVTPEEGEIKEVRKEGDCFFAKSETEVYKSLAIILATGLTNVPSIKGEKAFFGKGVSYCATCDGPLYRNKKALIYGDGDRALEEAAYLSNLVKELYLLTPHKHLNGNESLISLVSSKDNVTIVEDAKLEEIKGEDKVQKITFRKSDEEKEIATDVVFPLFGEKTASAFLSPLNVSFDKGFIKVDDSYMSNVPGLFAAGDIVMKKVRQVATAVGDGASVAAGVISYLHKLGR